MVYVASDGTVYQSEPWGIRKIVGYFWGIIGFIVAFFRTLLPGGSATKRKDDRRRSGSGGSGGPGGPGGPRRRIGRITTIQDCTVPGGG